MSDSKRMPDDQKFRELVIYISERSEADPGFGVTKLNKLLFYCDFIASLKLGKAMTWHRYQRLPHGPAPKAIRPILEKMQEAKEIAIGIRNHYGREQHRTMALREPRLSIFSADEIALITEVIADMAATNAASISELSHKFLGWQAAVDGEEIPYETAFINKPESTPHVCKRTAELESMARDCLIRNDG